MIKITSPHQFGKPFLGFWMVAKHAQQSCPCLDPQRNCLAF